MPRNKRLKNFWEPIYNPNDTAPFPHHRWDFTHAKGPAHSTFTARGLAEDFPDRKPVFTQVNFHQCDFEGNFNRPVVFKDCKFSLCDFGMSKWRLAKFTNCTFDRCSFTLTSFENCEFRGCLWEKICFTGNETRFYNTVITNPHEFVRSGYTNLDQEVLKKFKTTAAYQTMRLEGSKASIARVLYNTLSHSGEEDSYYHAVRTCLNQSVVAKIAEAEYYSKNGARFHNRLIFKGRSWIYRSEKTIVNCAGIINAWGSSIVRPSLIGLSIIILFAAAYRLLNIRPTISSSLLASLDTTLLIGYTKQVSRASPPLEETIFTLNMLIGLAWYAVFVPTVINRISRVR